MASPSPLKYMKTKGGLVHVVPRLQPWEEEERRMKQKNEYETEVYNKYTEELTLFKKKQEQEYLQFRDKASAEMDKKRKEPPPVTEEEINPPALPLPIEFKGEDKNWARLSYLSVMEDKITKKVLYHVIEKGLFNLALVSHLDPLLDKEDPEQNRFRASGAQCSVHVGEKRYHLLHSAADMEAALIALRAAPRESLLVSNFDRAL